MISSCLYGLPAAADCFGSHSGCKCKFAAERSGLEFVVRHLLFSWVQGDCLYDTSCCWWWSGAGAWWDWKVHFY